MDCVTEDFGIMIPKVNLNMQYCQLLRCTSKYSGYHEDADGIMITENDKSTPQSMYPYLGSYTNQSNVIVNMVVCAFICHSVSGEDGKNGGTMFV